MRVEISAVDRHDLEVTAWRDNDGWVEIYIRSAVGIAVPVQINPPDSLKLIIVPAVRKPIDDKEIRSRLLKKAAQPRAYRDD